MPCVNQNTSTSIFLLTYCAERGATPHSPTILTAGETAGTVAMTAGETAGTVAITAGETAGTVAVKDGCETRKDGIKK